MYIELGFQEWFHQDDKCSRPGNVASALALVPNDALAQPRTDAHIYHWSKQGKLRIRPKKMDKVLVCVMSCPLDSLRHHVGGTQTGCQLATMLYIEPIIVLLPLMMSRTVNTIMNEFSSVAIGKIDIAFCHLSLRFQYFMP